MEILTGRKYPVVMAKVGDVGVSPPVISLLHTLLISSVTHTQSENTIGVVNGIRELCKTIQDYGCNPSKVFVADKSHCCIVRMTESGTSVLLPISAYSNASFSTILGHLATPNLLLQHI